MGQNRVHLIDHAPLPVGKHIDRWCAFRGLPRGSVVTVEQCWQHARAWYGDKLRPDSRSRTLDEAVATLAAIGLTGPCWSLGG